MFRMKIWFNCLLCAFLLTSAYATKAASLEVTLLGTGTPKPDIHRFGPSTVIEANGHYFLFDAGRGASIRLKQANIPIQQINHIFLTHLHSDHISGFSDLWSTSWIWQRQQPLHVYGPKGTNAFAHHSYQAHSQDIHFRTKNTGLSESASQLQSKEINDGEVVFEKDGIRIIAFLVDHKVVAPAFGYRLEYGNRVVVISGDTTYSENLIKYAQNADVLIHEIAAAMPAALKNNIKLQKILRYHTTPEQAARIFRKTRPRLAVYNHVLLFGIKEDEVMQKTGEHYDGKVMMGQDLMRIKVGEKISISK